jgi:diguanylate cyclase (GGDEF)-like protein/PAS domain S-box-containing protein
MTIKLRTSLVDLKSIYLIDLVFSKQKSSLDIEKVLKDYRIELKVIRQLSEIEFKGSESEVVLLIAIDQFEYLQDLFRDSHFIKIQHKIILNFGDEIPNERIEDRVTDVLEMERFNHFSFGFVIELIGRRIDLSKRLRKSDNKLRRLYSSSGEGYIRCALDGTILDVNDRFARMIGYSSSVDLMRNVPNFFENIGLEIVHLPMHLKSLIGEKKLEDLEYQLEHREKIKQWVRVNCYMDDSEEIFFQISDLSSIKRLENQILHNVSYDFLTELPNRFEFNEILGNELLKAEKQQTSLGIVLIDLDDFKMVNDGFGHDAGDSIIIETAHRLRTSLFRAKAIARMGSDEFVALYTDVIDEQDLLFEVNMISEKFLMPFHYAGKELRLTCSTGILLIKGIYRRPEDIMRMADTALHKAKKQGGGNIVVYDDAMRKESERKINLVIDIERGLFNNEFRMFYQPIVKISTGKIVGFEALIRWFHPEKGMIPPLEFIQIAEETNLIIPMGRWILHEVCFQCQEWNEKGYGPVYASVNVSANQFLKSNFIDDLKETLAASKLDPGLLRVEITESMAMKNVEYASNILHQIEDIGASIAIDDFGTGYSSLAYLKKFPFSYLKIDRAFVSEVYSRNDDMEIVKAIVRMSQALHLKTIAEGVEEKRELDFLAETGCDYYQGYYFSKPLPVNEFEELLLTKKTGIE